MGGVTPGHLRIVPEMHILYVGIFEDSNYRYGMGINFGLGVQFDF